MQKFMLQSGKILELSYAPVETALNLLKSVMIECKNAGLNLKIGSDESIGQVLANNQAALLNVLSSDEVLEAVKECSERNLYDKQRFNMSLFDDVEARGDFIPVMIVTALENLRPFFPGHHIVFEMLEAGFLKG